jgi:predicted O-methyltransferase YrrM
MMFHIYRNTEAHLEDERRQNQALISLHKFIDLRLPLQSLAGWSAHPELAITIVEYIRMLNPEYIVEAGSGVSSIISCYCLEQNERGHLLALDHHQEYHKKTEEQLERHGLSEWGDVEYAPLQDYNLENKSWQWYDLKGFNGDRKVDMLIIDGPPLETQGHARYPALPLLYDQLAEKAVIILDDAARTSESEIVDLWLKKYPEFSFDYVRSRKGIAILSRNL